MPLTRLEYMLVFPTRVGVNRSKNLRLARSTCFPHPRGGEPSIPLHWAIPERVFPTRVGVNPHRDRQVHPDCPFSPPAWG